jgi:hypothetical protein
MIHQYGRTPISLHKILGTLLCYPELTIAHLEWKTVLQIQLFMDRRP